jgi:polyhydroxyalkanoate synthesis repressor PhaR
LIIARQVRQSRESLISLSPIQIGAFFWPRKTQLLRSKNMLTAVSITQQMVRDGINFNVLDAKTGDDITRSILTQIILEAESSGQNVLPVDFLRSIIRSYGDNLQGFLPSYLDLAMKSFADSREHFAKSLTGSFDLATPVEFFQQAVRANMSILAEGARFYNRCRAFDPIAKS